MGTGYWFRYIPLAGGTDGEAHTSLGIVVHDEVHPFPTIHTLERSLEWLKKHEPRCYEHVKDLPPLEKGFARASTRRGGGRRPGCAGERVTLRIALR